MDLPGIAIQDYFEQKSKAKLYVQDTFGPKVEMPISLYFRKEKDLPILEKKALNLCQGKILDIGAGAGCHSLILQEKGLDVTALEISPAACSVIRKVGVENVLCEDIFTYNDQKFDTLLLLMNGIGLSGTIDGLRVFLNKAKTLLNLNGSLIFDSSDISYMFEDEELPENKYFGEVTCRYEYKKQTTEWFSWLYIDQEMMMKIANEEGWLAEIIAEDENDQYLIQLKIK